MLKKQQLMRLLNAIACDDRQFTISNWNEDNDIFIIAIIDYFDNTYELTLTKQCGVISGRGYLSYSNTEVVDLIDNYIKAIYHADFRNSFVERKED